jgi:hypothetical protein
MSCHPVAGELPKTIGHCAVAFMPEGAGSPQCIREWGLSPIVATMKT